jgi:hypothetical protein
MDIAQLALISPSVVNTVVSAASLPDSATTAVSAPAVLGHISKRALKGKKNPPGSRRQQRKAHKAAIASALASTSARVASLSTELAETNRVLADAVEARDSARSDCSRAAAKAEEWKEKYRTTADQASRERLQAVSARLLEEQRARNQPSSSASFPAPQSLIPAPHPHRAPSRALHNAEPPC